ncbi:methylated-DNA--[protein]-cysteine S-methyltransferase [Oceanobacter kriegii]|uniref:methylated-DNA--[protein]-cysteine S-methyltransferase n=1 Tax=Oceanobacter kriegii TaxID=64972 RepID=UPI0004215662|nr:methylated-DNA--[protein]-cysteine S-methyltransferase [Oceanobacter kriegii]
MDATYSRRIAAFAQSLSTPSRSSYRQLSRQLGQLADSGQLPIKAIKEPHRSSQVLLSLFRHESVGAHDTRTKGIASVSLPARAGSRRSSNVLSCRFISGENHSVDTIQYGTALSIYGETFVAWSDEGICQISFLDADFLEPSHALAHQGLTLYDAIEALLRRWPKATIEENNNQAHALVESIVCLQTGRTDHLKAPLQLLIKGSDFQLDVWRQLLHIGYGELTTYGALAKRLGRPNASQAVGNAVGANPIAGLIPCHRVVRAEGGMGGYRWGIPRKVTMLLHEQSTCYLADQHALSER